MSSEHEPGFASRSVDVDAFDLVSRMPILVGLGVLEQVLVTWRRIVRRFNSDFKANLLYGPMITSHHGL
jgi:hypothetical protein